MIMENDIGFFISEAIDHMRGYIVDVVVDYDFSTSIEKSIDLGPLPFLRLKYCVTNHPTDRPTDRPTN